MTLLIKNDIKAAYSTGGVLKKRRVKPDIYTDRGSRNPQYISASDYRGMRARNWQRGLGCYRITNGEAYNARSHNPIVYSFEGKRQASAFFEVRHVVTAKLGYIVMLMPQYVCVTRLVTKRLAIELAGFCEKVASPIRTKSLWSMPQLTHEEKTEWLAIHEELLTLATLESVAIRHDALLRLMGRWIQIGIEPRT